MLIIQFYEVKTARGYLYRCLFTFFVLFLYGATRIESADYDSYDIFFEDVHYYEDFLSVNGHMEIGYTILNKLLPTFRILIVVTSFFTCLSFAVFFYKTIPAKYSWLAIIFLFLSADKLIFFMFNAMRNSIAICILIWSFSFIKKRQYLLMAVSVLLAYFFHTSSLLYMTLAFFIGFNRKMSYTEIYIWIIVMLLLIFTPISSIIEQINPVVDTYFERYEAYLDNESKDAGLLVTFGAVVMALFTLLFLKIGDLKPQEQSIGRLSLIFIYSYFLGSMNLRMCQWFSPFFIVFLVVVVYKIKDYFIKNIYIMCCVLFMAYSLFVITYNKELSPFKTFITFWG